MVHGGGFIPYQGGRWVHGWQVRAAAIASADRELILGGHAAAILKKQRQPAAVK